MNILYGVDRLQRMVLQEWFFICGTPGYLEDEFPDLFQE